MGAQWRFDPVAGYSEERGRPWRSRSGGVWPKFGRKSSIRGQADEIVARLQPPSIPNRAFPITRFGAVGDGVTDSSTAIAAAIAACVAAGGGRVIVPEGTFLTGPIRLQSRVNLHLTGGATLLFSTDPHKYPNVITRWEGTDVFNYSPLVYAFRESDIAITGEDASSILDGQASTASWWSFTGPAGADSLSLKQQAVPLPLGTPVTPITERIYGIDPDGTALLARR
jgi:hypothetical protein